MGQKQLLLLVLAVVLVGLAVAGGIAVVSHYSQAAQGDAERGADIMGSIEQTR